jgi:predicted methyltransferase
LHEVREVSNRRYDVIIAAIALAIALLPRAGFGAQAPATPQQMSGLQPEQIPPYIIDAINAPGRPAKDRDSDASRRPAQVMTFFGVKPGMQVADLWAGGGYTTELLARIVGPDGKVYSQNNTFPEKFKAQEELWKSRLAEPGMTDVVEVIKPFDAPDVLPVAPGTLDGVFINLNYHDLFDIGADPTKLNAAVFKALKPGGIYAIVDNSAQAGSGTRDTNTLHRIDEAFLTKQVQDAGFQLAATSDVLRNPKDPRTEPFWKVNHTQDRFILKFIKP